MARDYPRLDIETFGRHLIASGDLDPIYIALVNAQRAGHYDNAQVLRWIAAYSMFYHAGVASYLSEFEGKTFWDASWEAAANVTLTPTGARWPRGHERRHFRAKIALDSVDYLLNRYPTNPEDFISYIAGEEPREVRGGELCADPRPFQEVSKRAQEHRGYGPWIGFKLADMVDRCLGLPVAFDQAAVFMFKDPEKAAMMLWEQRDAAKYPPGTKPKREAILKGVSQYLEDQFSDLKAPPFADRPINIQEVETVLCKWKSHCNGHYPLFNDIREIRTGLLPWADRCVAAASFLGHMPSEPQ
jgi:hypothetical protein